jgi:hypothetical protein
MAKDAKPVDGARCAPYMADKSEEHLCTIDVFPYASRSYMPNYTEKNISNTPNPQRTGNLVVYLRLSLNRFVDFLYGDAIENWQDNKRVLSSIKFVVYTVFFPYVILGKGIYHIFKGVYHILKRNTRWAVSEDTPLQQGKPSIVFNFIETDRVEESLGDEKRQIDNSKSLVELTRHFTVSREWIQSYKIDREATKGSRQEFKIGGFELAAIRLAAENSLMERYSISSELKQSYIEEITVSVPAKVQLKIIFHWKKIWQRGLMQAFCKDKKIAEFPFQVVVGITFDQSQFVDETIQ